MSVEVPYLCPGDVVQSHGVTGVIADVSITVALPEGLNRYEIKWGSLPVIFLLPHMCLEIRYSVTWAYQKRIQHNGYSTRLKAAWWTQSEFDQVVSLGPFHKFRERGRR